MKRNAIFRMILWSITLVILMGMLLAGLVYPKARRWRTGSVLLPEQILSSGEGNLHSAQANVVRDLKIDWVSGDIQIQPADVSEIQVTESEVTDPRYAMVCKQDGQTLKIEFCEHTIFAGVKEAYHKNLTILVPRNWTCRELDVDAASARLNVENLSIREVNLDTASGASTFRDCNVEKLDIDTASGGIYFTGSLQELDCDSASAGIYAELTNVPQKVDVDTASGELELYLPKDAGFTVKLDSMSGSFDSDFPTVVQNGKYICGDGRCRVDMSSMSGKIIIRKA